MLTAIGQYVGAKVVTAVVAVSSIGAVIWFWRHPEQLETIWQTIKYVLAWLGVVIALPWATFFLTRWVVAKDSNSVAGLLLVGYVVADALAAFWMIGGMSGLNALTWTVLLVGFLSAAVYNLKVCEYLAERMEEGL